MKFFDQGAHFSGDIILTNKCYPLNTLIAYSKHKLKRSELLKLERHLIDCEICSVIVDGLNAGTRTNYTVIDKTLDARFRKKFNIIKKRSIKQSVFTIGLALTVIFAGLHFHRTTNDELFDKYFQPYPDNSVFLRSTQENVAHKILYSGIQFYAIGKYQDAAVYFNKFLSSNPTEEKAQFLLANTFLAMNELDKAEPLFREISENTDGDFSASSLWYLALIMVKNNNLTQAQALLNTIAEPNENEQVNRLKDDLEKLK